LIFDKVTDKNKLAPFLWPTVYFHFMSLTCFHVVFCRKVW